MLLLRLFVILQVVALNGVKVSNMQHLVSLVDGCSEDYLHFDLDYNQKVRCSTMELTSFDFDHLHAKITRIQLPCTLVR
jgi:hypothetical protein